jgi:hypothetical protein
MAPETARLAEFSPVMLESMCKSFMAADLFDGY